MRTRLFLSAAVATLSLCLSQGYAQQAGRGPSGDDAAKPGESTRMQNEKGATEQRGERRDERAQEQKRERGARETGDASDRPGAAAKDEDKRAAAKDESKRGAAKDEKKQDATKAEEKHGGAKKGEKHGATTREEQRGAANQDRDRAPTAQGGREMDRQDQTGESGATPGGRTGAATTDAERRATQAEADKAGRPGERAEPGAADAERRGTQAEADRTGRAGQMERRGEMDQQRGRDGFDRQTGEATRGAGRREAFEDAGRDRRGAGRFRLSQRENTRVRQILTQRNVQRISPDVFSPRIGAVLPPSVQFYPLPADVIGMIPRFRGFNYVMVGDDIAIIDPGTREVVTVLDEGGPGAAYGYGYGDDERYGYDRRNGRSYGSARRDDYRASRRDADDDDDDDRRAGPRRRGEAYGYAPRVRLDDRQERALYRGVMSEARSNLRQVCVRVGERVPESVDLEPVPRNIAAQAPDAERFDYFVLNDQVVLVDPDTRIVADIIERPR
jgi:hypothetical protein